MNTNKKHSITGLLVFTSFAISVALLLNITNTLYRSDVVIKKEATVEMKERVQVEYYKSQESINSDVRFAPNKINQ